MLVRIFLCYAHEDEELLNKLKSHLKLLQLQRLVDVWHDRAIGAGSEWEKEIDEHLNAAEIILLLISSDFINSDYCYSKEMARAMERHEAREAVVIPIILRPVDWQEAPFGKLQALPTDAEPVTSSKWDSQDKAFLDVAKGIRVVVEKQLAKDKVNQGNVFYAQKRYGEAVLAYDQALHLDPNNALAYRGKGNTFYDLHRYSEALEAYEHAYKAFLLAGGIGAVVGVGVATFVVGKLRDVEKQLAKDKVNQGNVFYAQKRYREAVLAYDQALHLDPNDALAYRGKSAALYGLHRYSEALEACKKAIRLDPNNAFAYVNKSAALCGLHRYSEALEACEKAIGLDPNNAFAYNNKGLALYNLQRYKEALAAYNQAIGLDPNNAFVYNNKGLALYNLQRYKEALAAYNQAIGLDPNNAAAYYGKGLALDKLNRKEEAQQAYEKARQLGYGVNLGIAWLSPQEAQRAVSKQAE